MCRHAAVLLLLAAAPAFAQSLSLVAVAQAAYDQGRYAASDSLYTEALGTGSPSGWDFYNAACSAALAGQVDRAFARLEAAAAAGFENVEHARTDRDLPSLRADGPRWAAFEASVQTAMASRYGSQFDPALRAELIGIRETDQAGRMAMQELGSRFSGAALDSAQAAMWAEQTLVDEANLARIEQIVAERGWPGFSIAGKDGSNAAWLVVQHASLETQQRYLPLMQAAVDAGDAAPGELALLIDRIRVRTDQPQLYGSQVRRNEGTGALEFFPIENEATVDARRAEMGLESLADYARNFGFEYVPPAE